MTGRHVSRPHRTTAAGEAAQVVMGQRAAGGAAQQVVVLAQVAAWAVVMGEANAVLAAWEAHAAVETRGLARPVVVRAAMAAVGGAVGEATAVMVEAPTLAVRGAAEVVKADGPADVGLRQEEGTTPVAAVK
jgi:hypothetical protein